MILFLEVILLLGILVAIAAVAVGRGGAMREDDPDRVDTRIPPAGVPVTPDDVDGIRFGMALRGYRMDEVDAALDRLRDEIADLRASLDRAAGAVVPDESLVNPAESGTAPTPTAAPPGLLVPAVAPDQLEAAAPAAATGWLTDSWSTPPAAAAPPASAPEAAAPLQADAPAPEPPAPPLGVETMAGELTEAEDPPPITDPVDAADLIAEPTDEPVAGEYVAPEVAAPLSAEPAAAEQSAAAERAANVEEPEPGEWDRVEPAGPGPLPAHPDEPTAGLPPTDLEAAPEPEGKPAVLPAPEPVSPHAAPVAPEPAPSDDGEHDAPH